MCAAAPHRPAPVLIDSAIKVSGFTQPRNEHATPYRVINYHTCNSCWNDPLAAYDRHDFVTCPRHKDTPRQFECTRLITAEQVIATIKRIRGFSSGRCRAAET
jgi:autotransporter strand-loop-strand O-heptosyltransferase